MKNLKYILALFLVFIPVAVYIALTPKAQNTKPLEASPSAQLEGAKNMNQLNIEDINVGTGSEAVSGKRVTVNYLGMLTNGTKFDSSYDRNQPFAFTLGGGEVIKGWDLGVAGMKVGGKRKLTIPPDLGYGSRSVGTIPANSALIFEVELLKVE